MKLVVERKGDEIVGSIVNIDDVDAELLVALFQDWLEEAEDSYKNANDFKDFWPNFAWYKASLVHDVGIVESYLEAFYSFHKKIHDMSPVIGDREEIEIQVVK